MVCPRCKEKVKQIFEKTGYQCITVEWGHVVIKSHHLSSKQQMEESLKENGIELLVSEEACQAEQVKILLISLLYKSRKITLPASLAKYLEMNMQKSFEELNHLFSSANRCSIQEYFNLLRFERTKELISYKDQSTNEIAMQLGYMKKVNLENAFEEILNISISEFSKNPAPYRFSLDRLIVN